MSAHMSTHTCLHTCLHACLRTCLRTARAFQWHATRAQCIFMDTPVLARKRACLHTCLGALLQDGNRDGNEASGGCPRCIQAAAPNRLDTGLADAESTLQVWPILVMNASAGAFHRLANRARCLSMHMPILARAQMPTHMSRYTETGIVMTTNPPGVVQGGA